MGFEVYAIFGLVGLILFALTMFMFKVNAAQPPERKVTPVCFFMLLLSLGFLLGPYIKPAIDYLRS
ncbi:hypothetical protein KJ903_03405 [Patescibacteria group bacterium]|nr:hypothetical protein [Patescibacteria group bacterium]